MRPWFSMLCLFSLILWGCPSDDADDDSSAADDDASDDDGADDDVSDDDAYTPPEELGPWLPLKEWSQVEDALGYIQPHFASGLIETMMQLTDDYGDGNCPVETISGPPDEILTEVVGGCMAGDTEFAGQYTQTEIDAGSYKIFIWEADNYFIRPATRTDVDDEEFFFHGRVYWSYNEDDLLGSLGAGLGTIEMGVIGETGTGIEAHYVGAAPGTPAWNHVYLTGMSEVEYDAYQQVTRWHDLYVTSNGFGTFTSNALLMVTDEFVCASEPLSGYLTITATIQIMFRFDGESACDGLVPVWAIDGGNESYLGDIAGDIW